MWELITSQPCFNRYSKKLVIIHSVIHAGTNDITKTDSEELLDKYRRFIQQYMTKSSNILISGVLPKSAIDSLQTKHSLANSVQLVDKRNDFFMISLAYICRPLGFQGTIDC